jgi:hypothetical protein
MSHVELNPMGGSGEKGQPVPPSPDRKWLQRVCDAFSHALASIRHFGSSGQVVGVRRSSLHAADAASTVSAPKLTSADLSTMALEMSRSGAILTEHQGKLEVEGRPRFFSNLSEGSENSSENARKFLEHLRDASTSDPEGLADRVQALHNFSISKWFQKALRQDPDLIGAFIITARQVVENAEEKTSLPDYVESKVRDFYTTLNTLGDIIDAVTKNGGTQQEAVELARRWMLGKLGVGEQRQEYVSPLVEERNFGRTYKTLLITPEGKIEASRYFEPAVDDENGRELFLDRFQTQRLFSIISEKRSVRPLPQELGNDQMGTYFYQVQQVGGSSQDKRQVPRLVGEPSSGTLREYVFQDVTMQEKLRATLSVVRGLRFLHERLYCNPSLGFNDIEVVNGRGKLARGQFVTRASLVNQEACLGAAGLAPELLRGSSRVLPAMDMFSFGAMLLSIVDPQSGDELRVAGLNVYKALRDFDAAKEQISFDEYKVKILNEYTSKIGEIQARLKAKAQEQEGSSKAMFELIHTLIDPIEFKRPDSTKAEERLQAIMQAWPKEEAEQP